MPIVKMEKPSLKSHNIKIEPELSNNYSNHFGYNTQNQSAGKIIKIITTRSKKPTIFDPMTDKDFLRNDHLIGKGRVVGKIFYLYFSKSQNINEARWIKAMDLRNNCKANLIRNALFQGRLLCPSKSDSNKNKPIIDTKYIQNYLIKWEATTKNKSKKSIKVRVQELESKFMYDFEVIKLQIKGIHQICDISPVESRKPTVKTDAKVQDYQEPDETSPPQRKRRTTKTVIKIEDDQAQKERSIQSLSDTSIESQTKKSIDKSVDKSVDRSVDRSCEKIHFLRSSISPMNLKKISTPQTKQQVIIDDDDANQQASLASYDSFKSQESISFSQRSDFSKEEVTNVKYVGRIKEKQGNFGNLYKFSLVYHPDIYSTMSIIKEDDFLRNAFLKFAEPLYEQYKK